MKKLLIGVVLALLSAGCEKASEPGANARRAAKPTSDILLKVGEHELSRKDADAIVDLQLKMSRNPKRARPAIVRTFADKFKVDCVFIDYAKKHEISVSDEELEKAVSRLVRQKRLTDGEKSLLRQMVRRELIAKQVHKVFLKATQVAVPASEVQERQRIRVDFNVRAAATNAIVYARATNCWQQIVGGKLTFVEAAEKFDETEERNRLEDAVWGEFALKAFAEEEERELVGWLRKMEVGDVTPPVEGDNGLVVVKLLGYGEEKSDGGERTYRLARIFFRLHEVWEPQTDEEMAADLKSIAERERWQKFLSRELESVKIEFPAGAEAFGEWQNRKTKEN